MTNYNERLDEILHDFAVSESLSETHLSDKLKRKVITADEYDDRLVQNYRENKAQAKQAFTSLTKELVAEAKPEKPKHIEITEPIVGIDRLWQQGRDVGYASGQADAINQFEQNLLKALEDL